MRERKFPVYLDHNATSPMRPAVVAAMVEAFGLAGNPSSVHSFGRDARNALERARKIVGDSFSATADNVIFTSGGTEANAMVLSNADGLILTSAIEHPSVLAAADSIPIGATSFGIIDLDALTAALRAHRPSLVSVMLANNETGAIQPIEQVAALVHRTGALLHVDAVQGPGKIEVDICRLGADFLSVSAHKIGGPRGVGAVILREGADLSPMLRGGGQERRRRAGTENLAGIVGFAAVIEDWGTDEPKRLEKMRNALELGVKAVNADALIVADAVERLPNTSCIALPGIASEIQVIALDLDGIAVSAGAACSSGKVEKSHVLEAMGLDEAVCGSAIRVSFGHSNEDRDVERFLSAWSAMAMRMCPGRIAGPP